MYNFVLNSKGKLLILEREPIVKLKRHICNYLIFFKNQTVNINLHCRKLNLLDVLI